MATATTLLPSYTQANSPMAVTTPLGPDALLLTGFSGHEGISKLFHFQLDLIAPNQVVKDLLFKDNAAFAKLLGQPVGVEVRLRGRRRYFNGICSRFTQGNQDDEFTSYRMEVVPKLWLLTRRTRSRIFQGLTVPQILDMVLKGNRLPTETQDPEGPRIDVQYQWNKLDDFKPRDYCVQYRETDFNFLNRLMEEEGIHYYFKHSAKGHQLWITDFPKHPSIFGDAPNPPAVVFQEASAAGKDLGKEYIFEWQKEQELRAGKYTMRDHCFEMQKPVLQINQPTPTDVQAGQVTHPLKLEANTLALELYDYPAEVAQRFDGIAPGGGDRTDDLKNVFPDLARTTKIRMQEEASLALQATGTGNCPHFSAGLTFVRVAQDQLKELLLGNDGEYLLVGVAHFADMRGAYRSGGKAVLSYQNSFTCVPTSTTFRRPPRVTPKPFVQGPQTATVVGMPGSEIFTDKYGRVKVKFHWDRDERRDANSSCWIRVAQVWAGNRWGASFWPRVGQEVVVAFLEGDPDQPLIIGSVYNYNQMPPYLSDGQLLPPDTKHKNDNKLSGIKTNSTPGGKGYNELRFDDTKGKEQVFIHAQNSMDINVNGSSMTSVGGDMHLTVGGEHDGKKSGDLKESVFQDHHVRIQRDRTEQIEGNLQQTVGKGEAAAGGNVDVLIEKVKKERVEQDDHQHVLGNRRVAVDQLLSVSAGGQVVTVGGDDCLHVGKTQRVQVDEGQSETVCGGRREKVTGGVSLDVCGPLKEKVDGCHSLTVTGARSESVGCQSLTVGGDQQEKVTGNHALEAKNIYLKAGNLVIEATTQLTLKVGGNFIAISAGGIDILGMPFVKINTPGGAPGTGTPPSPSAPEAPDAPEAPPDAPAPEDAQQAAPAKPAGADSSRSGYKSAPEETK